jgi:Holliday junction DNA helicase RuvA
LIYRVKGLLIEKTPNTAVIDVGGVAFETVISVNTFSELPETGNEVTLYTHLVLKEDMAALFGFYDLLEKKLYLMLNKVSKVGPKLAIAILSGIDAKGLKRVITESDVQALSSVPGIGKKTAERIILELKDKFDEEIITDHVEEENNFKNDVLSALVNLGYKKQECTLAIRKFSSDFNDFEPLLKQCLKVLGK